jgi:hypothetical protein
MRIQATLGLAALLAGRVQAQTTVNPLAQTGLSGFTATRTTVLGSSSVGGIEALQEISWTELGDQPCLLKITYGSFNGGQLSFRPEMNICDWNENTVLDPFAAFANAVSIYEGLASWKTVTFANRPRYFIRGIAVCKTGSDNNRIKGIRIYPAKVWNTARDIEVINEPVAATRTNCGDWDSPAFCPSNYIAVELMVYHRPHQITGLGLKCRPVEY